MLERTRFSPVPRLFSLVEHVSFSFFNASIRTVALVVKPLKRQCGIPCFMIAGSCSFADSCSSPRGRCP